MGKIDWKEARRATVEAEKKKAANEAATRIGTTVEEIQQTISETQPTEKAAKSKQKGGRPTTAEEEPVSVTLRITPTQNQKINEWVYLKKGANRSDVVRKALDLMFGD